MRGLTTHNRQRKGLQHNRNQNIAIHRFIKSHSGCRTIPCSRIDRKHLVRFGSRSSQNGFCPHHVSIRNAPCQDHSSLVGFESFYLNSSACTDSLCRLEVSRSHRILWLLEELQIPYELKTYKRGADMLADPKLREVHPLGKSPVVTIETPGVAEPMVLAESGFICEYLCDHYGKWLIPQRYQDGKDGQAGGETASWLRYRYYMHYAEGSLMPLMLITLLVSNIKNSPVPFSSSQSRVQFRAKSPACS